MREAELHWRHWRLVGGTLTNAQQGPLRFRRPVGFVSDAAGRSVLDPDEEIHHAGGQVGEGCATATSA
jgi:hypothetical protein